MNGARSFSGAILAVFALAVSAVLLGVGLDSSASFSDHVRLGRNELVAGTIDITVGNVSAPVMVTNLAPGDRSMLTMELQNSGTLPMVVTADVVAASDSDTVGELDVEHWLSDQNCEDPANAIEVDRLAPVETGRFCLAVGLPLSASNSSQGLTANFTIIVTGVHDVIEGQSTDQSESQE